MLELGGDDMLFSLARLLTGDHLQRPVVRFAAAGGDEHLVGAAAQIFRDALPGGGYPLPRLLPEGVEGRGVAVSLGEIGHHFIQRLRRQPRGSGVIRIYKAFHSSHPLYSLSN